MSKKNKAFQLSALLTAVSGATLLVSADTIRAAEIRTADERCWDQQPITPREYRLNNCDFIQYGLLPSDDPNTDPSNVDTPDAGGGGGPTPVDPYTGG